MADHEVFRIAGWLDRFRSWCRNVLAIQAPLLAVLLATTLPGIAEPKEQSGPRIETNEAYLNEVLRPPVLDIEDPISVFAYVLRNLKEIVERCMQHKPVTDANGDPVFVETPTGKIAAAYTFRPDAAVSALKLLGTELGMFIQRHAVVDDPFAALPAQLVREIVESLSRLKDAAATRVIEHEPAGRPLLADQPAS